MSSLITVLFATPPVIRVFKSTRVRWANHVVRKVQILFGIPEGG
jgi:hypothetical protein